MLRGAAGASCRGAAAAGACAAAWACWPRTEGGGDGERARARVAPLAAASRAWGGVARAPLPGFARRPLLGAYCRLYGADAREASRPLEEYESLAAFFSRELRPGARKVATEGRDGRRLLSPCDGHVLAAGRLRPGGVLEQVKGMTYRPEELLDVERLPEGARNLHYAVIYLAPGDYHAIHAPAALRLRSPPRRVPGRLLPVSPAVAAWVPRLHATNERLILEGEWADGRYLGLVAVGALGVGSIVLERGLARALRQELPSADAAPGERLGAFEMGSTVVLLYDAPEDWALEATEGAAVRMGQPLARQPPCK